MYARTAVAAVLAGAASVGALFLSAPAHATRCTDQINYAGDPRSNAEINSIGATTGQCPAPLTGAVIADAPTGCNSQSLLPALLASGAIENVGLARPTCVGDWAMASTTAAPPAQNAAVLFHRVNGTWQYVTYGSYWDCVGVNGVPPEAAAMFAGCYQH